MIIGMGIDLCRISRIEKISRAYGQRFLNRVFSEPELRWLAGLPGSKKMAAYAKGWAAKEACAKALGTGLLREGVLFRDICVSRDVRGKPELALYGGAATRLKALLPPGTRGGILLSLSDEPPFAMAQVLIQALLQTGLE